MSDSLNKTDRPWYLPLYLPGFESSLGHLKGRQLAPQTGHPHAKFVTSQRAQKVTSLDKKTLSTLTDSFSKLLYLI